MRMRPEGETASGRLKRAMTKDGFMPLTAVQWKSYHGRQLVLMGGVNVTGDKWRIYYLFHVTGMLSGVQFTERPASEVNLK